MSEETKRRIIAGIVLVGVWVVIAGGLYLMAMAGQP